MGIVDPQARRQPPGCRNQAEALFDAHESKPRLGACRNDAELSRSASCVEHGTSSALGEPRGC
jgi:hypothetical protein